jgi:hypothetical protein
MPTIDGPVLPDVDLVDPMVADLVADWMADLSWLRRSGGCLLLCLCLFLWWSYARSGDKF